MQSDGNATNSGKEITMASVEYLEKRIAGKEKELAKLQKKMARIEKAVASNWENNPYYYNERDLKITARDIEEAEKRLADYREQLATEQAKANSRNVQVILDFLDAWETKSMELYVATVPAYLKANEEFNKRYAALAAQIFDRSATHEERMEKRAERNALCESHRKEWGWIDTYIYRGELETERLRKDLDREAERKYDYIIDRTNAIVKEITDASNLYISDNGELNGYIIGTGGTAEVRTIGAGGYNIQRFHFRTLVHKK